MIRLIGINRLLIIILKTYRMSILEKSLYPHQNSQYIFLSPKGAGASRKSPEDAPEPSLDYCELLFLYRSRIKKRMLKSMPSIHESVVKKRILFLCTHNAARSQMAEGYLRIKYGDRYEAFSAGTEPSRISPFAITVMAEIGVDISGQESKSLKQFFGKEMDLVVTVCDSAQKVCPAFPWTKKVIHQSFPDPELLHGSENDILAGFRKIRDDIVKWLNGEFGS